MDKRALRHQGKCAQIQEVVLSLANEKMPENITVRDICVRAQVAIGPFERLVPSGRSARSIMGVRIWPISEPGRFCI